MPRFRIEIQEREVEVPSALQQERGVEVPEVQLVDIVTQVAKPYTEYVDKRVPLVETQAVERTIEVPQTLQVQVAEAIRQVLEPTVQQSVKEVPRVEMEYVERVVQVESRLQDGSPAPPQQRQVSM